MPRLRRDLVAGVFVVFGAGLAAWLLTNGEAASSPLRKKERGLIKEVKPASAPTNVVKEVKKPYSKYRAYDPDKVYKDGSGVLRYKKGNGRVPHSDEEMKKYLIHQPKYDTGLPEFKYNCEMEIATLLTLEPGRGIVGNAQRGKHFEQEFLAAVMEPIEIKDDDSERDKQIKRDVEAAKKEMVKRLKEGENISDMIDEARNEMRRLAAYKEQAIELAREQLNENENPTIEDADLCLEALNKILESKGIAAVKKNAIVNRRLLREMAMQRDAVKKQTIQTTKESE